MAEISCFVTELVGLKVLKKAHTNDKKNISTVSCHGKLNYDSCCKKRSIWSIMTQPTKHPIKIPSKLDEKTKIKAS